MAMVNDNALAKREARAVRNGVEFSAMAGTGFNDSILKVVDSATAEYVVAYNALDGAEKAVEWQRWALIARVWNGFKAIHKDAKYSDLEGYFVEKPSTLATMIKCGQEAKIAKSADGKKDVLDVPRDINGEIFTPSKFSQIYKHRGRIADGYFLASMSADDLKKRVKVLNGVVDSPADAKADAKADAQADAQADAKADAKAVETEADAVAVYVCGQPVSITPEQARAILDILGFAREE